MLKIRPNLSAIRKERLNRFFNRFKDRETCEKVLFQLISNKQKHLLECPHCQSSSTVRFGKYRDRQRYKCQSCLRTFNDLTNTPLHYTHSPLKWIKFIHCLIQKLTLAATCCEIKISYATAHYWRHKIIHALEHLNPNLIKEVPCPNSYPYICVRQYPPNFHGNVHDKMEFANWIRSFNWIAKRFANRYIAWFQFVQKLDLSQDLEAIKNMLFSACSIPLVQTYETVKT